MYCWGCLGLSYTCCTQAMYWDLFVCSMFCICQWLNGVQYLVAHERNWAFCNHLPRQIRMACDVTLTFLICQGVSGDPSANCHWSCLECKLEWEQAGLYAQDTFLAILLCSKTMQSFQKIALYNCQKKARPPDGNFTWWLLSRKSWMQVALDSLSTKRYLQRKLNPNVT